jgi:uncharacterized membrane protein (DUF485 family)
MESKNARLGLQLFFVYLLLYGGFVMINAFAPEMMERTPVAGINLAILYGFGLIVAALLLALLYGMICKGEDETATSSNNASISDNASSTKEDA